MDLTAELADLHDRYQDADERCAHWGVVLWTGSTVEAALAIEQCLEDHGMRYVVGSVEWFDDDDDDECLSFAAVPSLTALDPCDINGTPGPIATLTDWDSIANDLDHCGLPRDPAQGTHGTTSDLCRHCGTAGWFVCPTCAQRYARKA